ncbi:MAG TPA: hypothetical protein VF243_01580 [Nitrosospira sp.]
MVHGWRTACDPYDSVGNPGESVSQFTMSTAHRLESLQANGTPGQFDVLIRCTHAVYGNLLTWTCS